MPLTMGDAGTVYLIQKVGGNDEVRLHLEAMGFVQGAEIALVSQTNGNVIVNVKNIRVAISETLARKLIVTPRGEVDFFNRAATDQLVASIS